MLDGILAKISAPKFPDRDFPITDYGAKSDGDDRLQGGDRQGDRRMPRGRRRARRRAGGQWLANGPIHLKSNVNLQRGRRRDAARSARSPSDYLPAVFTRFEGTEVMNYSPLIYAIDQENIAVTGEGTLDGQASNENWWTWKRQGGDSDIAKLVKMAEDGVPPEQRKFGEGFTCGRTSCSRTAARTC